MKEDMEGRVEESLPLEGSFMEFQTTLGPQEVEEVRLPNEIAEVRTIETREINLTEEVRQGAIYPRYLLEAEYELPPGYGETKIVLQVRDPYWMHAYWEITEEAREDIRRRLGPSGWEETVKLLRVHDVTDTHFDGTNAHYSFDIPINEIANNWYINVERPNRSYCVDLGVRTKEGEFILISRSNTVRTPRDGVSEVIDEEWMTIEALERAYKPKPGPGPSSPEFAQALRERLEHLMGSEAISSLFSPGFVAQKERGFWLVADVELIVYGATEPDASLTVQGMPVKLRPDGTFTVRFALPDGEEVIPIEARSRDGQLVRRITPIVRRVTT